MALEKNLINVLANMQRGKHYHPELIGKHLNDSNMNSSFKWFFFQVLISQSNEGKYTDFQF